MSWPGDAAAFEIEPYRRHALMAGLDEIGMALTEDEADIAIYEARRSAVAPWLFLGERTRRYTSENHHER